MGKGPFLGLRSVASSGDLLTRPPLLSSQAVCAIFEKSVKTLLDDFAPMVPQLCEMLGRMYSTIPQASALDLTRQVGLYPRQRSDPGIGRMGGIGWMVALAGVLACIPGTLACRGGPGPLLTSTPCFLQLVHIFAHEPAHFPPIEALFLLVTSVTLTLFQQGRSRPGSLLLPPLPLPLLP